MTIMVDWPATAATTAGIILLLGYAWFRRGPKGALQACVAIGAWRVIAGALTGSVIEVGAGVVILLGTSWCLWYIREPRQDRGTRS